MSSPKANTINKTAFSIKSAEETFTRAALYESFRKSEILHHVYLENVPTPVLREILNFEHSFIFRQLPVLGSKLAVKFGLEFLVSRFPRLQNYIQPSVLPIRLEDDERLALLEMIRAKPKPNLYVIVAKNISLNVLGISISNIRDAITHSNLSSNELIDMFQLNKTNTSGDDELKKDLNSANNTAKSDTNGVRKDKSNVSGVSESENEELMNNNDDNEPQKPIHTPPTVYSDLFSSSWQTSTQPLQRQSRSRSRSITPTHANMPRERATSTTPIHLHQTIDKSVHELQRHQLMLPPPPFQNRGLLPHSQRNSIERNENQHYQSVQLMQQRKAHKRHRYDSVSSNGSRRSRSISSSSSSVQSSREPTPIRNLTRSSSFQSPKYQSQQHSRQTSQSPEWSDANSGVDDDDYTSHKQMKPSSPKKQKSIEILNVEVIPAPGNNDGLSRHLSQPGALPSTTSASVESLSAIPKTLTVSEQSENAPTLPAVHVKSNQEYQHQKSQKVSTDNAHSNGNVQDNGKLHDIKTTAAANNVNRDENIVVSDNDNNFDKDQDLYADDIISGDEIKLSTKIVNEKQIQTSKTAIKLPNKLKSATKDNNDFNTDFYEGSNDVDDDVVVLVNGSSKSYTESTSNRNHETVDIDDANVIYDNNDDDDDEDDFAFDDNPMQAQFYGTNSVNGKKRQATSNNNDSELNVKRLKADNKVIGVDTIQTTKFRNESRLNGSNVTYNDIISVVNGLKDDNKTPNATGFTTAFKNHVVSKNEYNDIDDVDDVDDDDLEIIENDEFNAMHKRIDSLKKTNSTVVDKWNNSIDNVNSKLPSEIVKVDTVNFDDNYEDDDDDELVYE